MEFQDYYQTLGVDRSATSDQIKKQYRRMARKYHPDVSKEANAEEKFKQVKEAYEVLKDAEKRKAYDQFGSQWKQGQGFEPPSGSHTYQRGQQQHADAGQYSDFFESIFGGGGFHAGQRGRGRSFKQKGQDQHSKIAISLEEAYSGTTRSLGMREPAMNPQTGQVSYKTKSLNVKIPAGVTQGQHIRLAGQGSAGIGGGPNGDLYLEVELLPHPLYSVEGRDIHLKLPITPWEAALGATVETPTLGGKIKVTIPAGSQTGKKMRLKGRGLAGKTAGDQYLLLNIYTPEPNNDKQKELYQQMKEQMDFDPRKDLMEGR